MTLNDQMFSLSFWTYFLSLICPPSACWLFFPYFWISVLSPGFMLALSPLQQICSFPSFPDLGFSPASSPCPFLLAITSMTIGYCNPFLAEEERNNFRFLSQCSQKEILLELWTKLRIIVTTPGDGQFILGHSSQIQGQLFSLHFGNAR